MIVRIFYGECDRCVRTEIGQFDYGTMHLSRGLSLSENQHKYRPGTLTMTHPPGVQGASYGRKTYQQLWRRFCEDADVRIFGHIQFSLHDARGIVGDKLCCLFRCTTN